jgi:hypothetical protein
VCFVNIYILYIVPLVSRGVENKESVYIYCSMYVSSLLFLDALYIMPPAFDQSAAIIIVMLTGYGIRCKPLHTVDDQIVFYVAHVTHSPQWQIPRGWQGRR